MKPYYPFLVFKSRVEDEEKRWYYVGLYCDSEAFGPADICRNQTQHEWVFVGQYMNAFKAEADLNTEVEVLTYQLETGDFV